MAQSPSPDSNHQSSKPEPSIGQQVENSSLGGGMQATQGNGNIQIYNQIDISSLQTQNRTLEDRVNQIQKEFRDFHQQYESILKAFEEFKNIASEKLENLSPENVDTREALTELLAKILQYQISFESFNNASSACQEASEWLSNNRNQLVLDTRNFIRDNAKEIGVEFYPEQIEYFCKVVDHYLFWIGNEMVLGRKPNHLPENIPICLPKSTYIKAFEFLKEKISCTHNLPIESVNYLRTYLTRFIIQPLSQSQ